MWKYGRVALFVICIAVWLLSRYSTGILAKQQAEPDPCPECTAELQAKVYDTVTVEQWQSFRSSWKQWFAKHNIEEEGRKVGAGGKIDVVLPFKVPVPLKVDGSYTLDELRKIKVDVDSGNEGTISKEMALSVASKTGAADILKAWTICITGCHEKNHSQGLSANIQKADPTARDIKGSGFTLNVTWTAMAGITQVEVDDVIIQGPATFDVSSTRLAQLSRGRKIRASETVIQQFTRNGDGAINITIILKNGAGALSVSVPATDSTIDPITRVRNRDKLVSFWAGEYNYVDSMGNHHGALSGPPDRRIPAFTQGQVGSAFLVDSTHEGFIVPSDRELELTEAVTIDAWVKPLIDDGGGIILSKGNGHEENYRLGLTATGTGDYFVDCSYMIGNDNIPLSTNPANSFVPPQANTTIPTDAIKTIHKGKFSHVVGIIDTSKGFMRIYINGVLAAAGQTKGPMQPNREPVICGYANYLERHQFRITALLDEIKLYSRALSDDEVMSDYNMTRDGQQ